MNTTVKLFDANNKLVPNFDEEIEKILISVHGEAYYDIDEELVNTNELPVIEAKETEPVEEKANVEKAAKSKKVKRKGISIKDFIPVLFFILIFAVIVIAGYYFLNTVDLLGLVGVN